MRENVLNALNRQQMNMGNSPMDWNYWNGLRTDVKHTLLERNEFFATVYSYVYYKMLARAEKYRDPECRKFAEDTVKEVFNQGTVSGVKYGISTQQRDNIRRRIMECFTTK